MCWFERFACIDIVESDNPDGSASVSCYTARCKSFMKFYHAIRSESLNTQNFVILSCVIVVCCFM